MTPRQIELVQASFDSLKANADAAATLFYDRLFSVTPELRGMFTADMSEQKKKLFDMLQVAIDNLHRVDVSQYTLVGGALPWTLEQALRPEFTPAMKASWTEIHTTLAGV